MKIESLLSFLKGQDWRYSLLHEETCDLLVYITRGQGVFYANGVKQGVGANTVFIIPKGRVHAFELGRQSTGMVMRFDSQTMGDEVSDINIIRLRDVEASTALTGLLLAAQKESESPSPLQDECVLIHQQMIELWARRQVLSAQKTKVKLNAATRLVWRFFDNLPLPSMQGASMAEHAKLLGVTPTHLSRASRECTGLSAADHLTNRQLFMAQKALLNTRSCFKQIADDLNFNSAAYFSRFIQQHTGMSPSQFRKEKTTSPTDIRLQAR